MAFHPIGLFLAGLVQSFFRLDTIRRFTTQY